MSHHEGPSDRTPNRLADETSAYLRQHMYNPVDWHPWGEEALALAKARDLPLLVSIGYSACHWCHVMERESFEDADTAALMNARFVPIKVDREERPDVDQIYMDTVVRLSGHGGWPLTVFCAPDGRPFHAGTYYPPEPRHGLPSFRQVLEAASRAYHEQRDQIDQTAARILEALAERPHGVAQETPGVAQLVEAARKTLGRADSAWGGFGGGPKFPTPSSLDVVLAALPELPEDEAAQVRQFLAQTFTVMSRRGLYDPLGGGFHRYCVDRHWGVPHFEKMLYDQGQLMRSYAEWWRLSGCANEDLVWPIRETAQYLAREMTGDEGGLFASQDADSEGEEGLFYVWTPGDVEDVLGDARGEAFNQAYGVTPDGNFDGRSVLWDGGEGAHDALAAERQELLAARARRVPPATDRKRVAAWNGYAISGLAHAGGLLDDPGLIAQAAAVADFVLTRMRDGEGRLLRVYAEGAAKIPGFLDDVAAMLSGCLDLFRAGGDARTLDAALELADDVASRFFDADEGDLFLAPADGERLAHRPRSDPDGATPHSAGLAVLSLLRAASLSGRERLRAVAESVLRTYAFQLERAPHALPTLARAAAWSERGISGAVIVGAPDRPETGALALAARRALAPEEAVIVVADAGSAPASLDPTWLAGREPEGDQPTAWICRGVVCSLPTTDPEEIRALLALPAAPR